MYAVVVAVSIENEEEAREQLLNQVVPGVKQIPGVVSGVWLAPQNGQGSSTVVFETEEQAKAASETVRDRVPPGVTVNHVGVQEVAAHF